MKKFYDRVREMTELRKLQRQAYQWRICKK